MSCQPSVKIGNHADLHFSCLLCVALATHLCGIGIEIRTQGSMQLAQVVFLKNLFHRCSPSRQASQKTPPDYAGKLDLKLTSKCRENALTRNSPEPGIVSQSVGWMCLCSSPARRAALL